MMILDMPVFVFFLKSTIALKFKVMVENWAIMNIPAYWSKHFNMIGVTEIKKKKFFKTHSQLQR